MNKRSLTVDEAAHSRAMQASPHSDHWHWKHKQFGGFYIGSATDHFISPVPANFFLCSKKPDGVPAVLELKEWDTEPLTFTQIILSHTLRKLMRVYVLEYHHGDPPFRLREYLQGTYNAPGIPATVRFGPATEFASWEAFIAWEDALRRAWRAGQ